DPFREVVEAAGLGFRSIFPAEEYRRLVEDPDLWHPRKGFGIALDGVGRSLRSSYAALEDLYRPRATVLVGHTLSFAARVFEEERGGPAVTVHLAPGVFRSDHRQPVFVPGLDLSRLPVWSKRFFWRLVDLQVDRFAAPALSAFRAERGLPPV